jgi:hypothetical protein
MKRQTTVVMLSLVVMTALAACGGAQVPPTVVVEIPTSRPAAASATAPPGSAATAPAVAGTIPPTGQASATQPSTSQPLATTGAATVPATPGEGVGGGGGAQEVTGSNVVLADLSVDPPQLTAVDPATGEAQVIFSAPGLIEGGLQWVAGNYVFYLDEELQVVKRVAFDNTLIELPFVNPSGEFFEGQFLPSPDGERIAWGTYAFEPNPNGDNHNQLKVANVDGTGEQILFDKRLQDESILPTPLGWSADGRFLYFTNVPYGIGGYILFRGGPDLQQVDLTTGVMTEILPNMGCLCPMSLSPDGSTVAYVGGLEPLELVLHEVVTGAERRAPLEAGYRQAGSIVWSPDGELLMLTMAIGNFEQQEKEAFSVVRLDVATLAQTVLIRDDALLLETIVWPVAGTVWLNDIAGRAWRMEAQTGALTQSAVAGQVMGVVR